MEALSASLCEQSSPWTAATFSDPSDYLLILGDAERTAIHEAVADLERSGRPLEPADGLARDEFQFGSAESKLAQAYDEVRSGRGFAILRGLPRDGLTLAQFIAVVWGIGTRLGDALSQNAEGEQIGHVVNAGGQDATPRMFRSNLELRLHTDITAMIGLACWNAAKAGGTTVITSSATVHDNIARRAPHLLEPLYRGFHYHRLGEEGPDEEPVTPYRVPVFAKRGGRISCRYQRTGIAAGHHELGMPLTEIELEALNLFDEVAQAAENRLALRLEPGDMALINNYTVMHARTQFEDFAEPVQRRHLVRLWLDRSGFQDVPTEFNHFATNGIPPQPGRRCTYDFKKLYREDPVSTGGVAKLNLSDIDAPHAR